MVCFEGVFQEGRLAKPEYRDQQTHAVRQLVSDVRESDRLLPVLLPVSDGLLCAVKR
jgi:predicted O-methyltransferase YrrM